MFFACFNVDIYNCIWGTVKIFNIDDYKVLSAAGQNGFIFLRLSNSITFTVLADRLPLKLKLFELAPLEILSAGFIISAFSAPFSSYTAAIISAVTAFVVPFEISTFTVSVFPLDTGFCGIDTAISPVGSSGGGVGGVVGGVVGGAVGGVVGVAEDSGYASNCVTSIPFIYPPHRFEPFLTTTSSTPSVTLVSVS